MGEVSIGLIFAIMGIETASRTIRTELNIVSSTAFPRKVIDPCGQEVFSSMASAPTDSSIFALSTHPSSVVQFMLGIIFMSSFDFASATS